MEPSVMLRASSIRPSVSSVVAESCCIVSRLRAIIARRPSSKRSTDPIALARSANFSGRSEK